MFINILFDFKYYVYNYIMKINVVKLIGRGAFGNVYYGKNEIGEDLAIKMIDTSKIDKKHIESEIEILKKINCDIDNVLCYFDYGIIDNKMYIITKYIKDSKELIHLKDENINLKQKIDIMIKLTETFEKISKRGILHLDIKPQNILYYKSDDVYNIYIIDFGLSCLISEEIISLSCKNTKSKGTGNYMSPDIIINPSNVDYKTDIYSLGLVFYYMLTFKFRGEIIRNILDMDKEEILDNKKISKFIRDIKNHNILVEEIRKDLKERNIPELLIKIICEMINYNQNHRINYRDILDNLNIIDYLRDKFDKNNTFSSIKEEMISCIHQLFEEEDKTSKEANIFIEENMEKIEKIINDIISKYLIDGDTGAYYLDHMYGDDIMDMIDEYIKLPF
jgi:serine/threonine protein kinase